MLRRSACRTHPFDPDNAALLLSELVTNAVVHAGPPLLVSLSCDGATTAIGVHDGSSEVSDIDPPAMEDLRGFSEAVDDALPEIAEHGRGLVFMDLLAERWDVTLDEQGKWVVFHLAATAVTADLSA